ncbi:MAG: hypothetical protein QXO86_06225 [Nitrososphaerota archaeon]
MQISVFTHLKDTKTSKNLLSAKVEEIYIHGSETMVCREKMTLSRLIGFLMMVFSPVGLAFYTLWFFGLLKGFDPELALRLTVYALASFFFSIVGVLGYLVVTAPRSREGGEGG